MAFGLKKTVREFIPETGERLKFMISNNGSKKWTNASEKTKKEALEFMDDCIASVQRMKLKIENL